MGSVLLYKMKRRVNLTLEGKYRGLNRNMAMHNPDFKVFKGTQTEIEFIVRDTDRKPINLSGYRLQITLVNRQTNEVILNAPLPVVDAARGICKFECFPRLIQDIAEGWHNYTVSYLMDNNNPRLLTLDHQEEVHGTFEVLLGNRPDHTPTQEFSFEHFRPAKLSDFGTMFVSPALLGNMQRGSTFGLHTIAFHLEKFTGSVWIEGSVQNSVPGDYDWFPVLLDNKTELRLRNADGIYSFNIEANLMWVRIKVLFDQVLQNGNPARAGEIKKVQFRN